MTGHWKSTLIASSDDLSSGPKASTWRSGRRTRPPGLRVGATGPGHCHTTKNTNAAPPRAAIVGAKALLDLGLLTPTNIKEIRDDQAPGYHS